MVNPEPGALAADVLASVRDRALELTDVPVVVAAHAPGTPIVWVNEAFTRSTGYTLEEAVGRSPRFLQGPATDRAETARVDDAIAAGRPVTATLVNYRKDRTPFWNLASITPVTVDGEVRYWVSLRVDITDQVQREVEQQRSIEAERRARTGLTLVSQVSELLADSDNPQLLREISGLLRGPVVEWADFLLDDGGLRPAHGIGHDGTPLSGDVPCPRDASAVVVPGAPDPVAELLDGRLEGPVEVALDDRPVGAATARVRDHARSSLARRGELATRTVVHTVPGRRGNLGVLVSVPLDGAGLDEMDPGDLTVLWLVARRVGQAVDNVRLYAREHRMAEALQRAMLPEQADVDDLDVWSYYAPAAGHAQVGGDWYDVLQVADGRLVLVVGDVVGHDVEAAAAMGQLRSMVRAIAFDTPDPGDVLTRVDQIVAGMRLPRSASLVIVTLVQDEDTWCLRYSRAGHLPPLVADGEGVVTLSEAGGPLIGFGDAPRTSVERHLRPGDLLVLYTDGLIERRDRSLRDGLEALVATTGSIGPQDAAGAGEELLSRFGDHPEDDVALVVVRVPDPTSTVDSGEGPRRRRWSLPSEPGSIRQARRAVARTCAAWDIGGVQSAELVVSELMANAVMHGWGHIVLRLFDTGTGLRIEIEDSNPAPPVTTDGHPGRVGGYGMRIVERLGDWGWRPTSHGKLVWARVRPAPLTVPGAGA